MFLHTELFHVIITSCLRMEDKKKYDSRKILCGFFFLPLPKLFFSCRRRTSKYMKSTVRTNQGLKLSGDSVETASFFRWNFIAD